MMVAAAQHVKEEEYWLQQLAGDLEKTCFPYDFEPTTFPHPYSQEKNETTTTETTLDGLSQIEFTLQGDIFSRLLWLSNNSDPRLHMILVTSVLALLYKYSYRHTLDSLSGMPVYKQGIGEGVPINTLLILRNGLTGNTTFKELLLDVKKTITDAVENQNYPFPLLAHRLDIFSPDTGVQLLDIFILLENIMEKNSICRIPPGIVFSFRHEGDSLICCWDFQSKLYKKTTIERMSNHFRELLETALFKPETRLDEIDILSEKEKQWLLVDLNRVNCQYPFNQTIHGIFSQQAERNPDLVAVKGEMHMTYRELDRVSDTLGHSLRERGIHGGSIAALLMKPSVDMIASILGILKSGAAYLPIEPDHPSDRVGRMLYDAVPRVLITEQESLKNHSYTLLKGLHQIGVKPVLTSQCAAIDFMDNLPFPDRSLVNYDKYNRFIGQAMVKHAVSLQGTRGCPYNCTYCHKIWGKKHVVRSAGNLFDEVKLYYDMGVRRFVLIDDIFNLDIKNSSEFFKKILDARMKPQFFFPNGLRGDILTKDYIDLMVEAGTVELALALETASPRLQKLIRKNLNLDKLEQNLDYFEKKYPGVILELFTMHGFPTETEEEAMMTLDFIKRQHWLHFPYLHILKIYPNTEMAELAMEHGIPLESIQASTNLAYHQLPTTLPFDKRFTLNVQANFLNNYFLNKERLLHVLPYQAKVLTEDELAEKYDSYLPIEITDVDSLLRFLDIKREDLGMGITGNDFVKESDIEVPSLDRKIKDHFPRHRPKPDALRVLFIDLSQYFSRSIDAEFMLYDVVEPPLGLMYLTTYIHREMGDRVHCKIAKSRIDFDSFEELENLLETFKPHVIGVRALTYYKDFLHQTVSYIRRVGFTGPLIAGGPYATSDYASILQDTHIDVVVMGEGEKIAVQLLEKIAENNKQLPDSEILKTTRGIAFIEEKNNLAKHFHTDILVLDEKNSSPSSTPQTYKTGSLPPTASAHDPAYIIFTSGSTGKPKGAIIEHRNVVRLLFNDEFQFDFNSTDIWSLFHSYCFDFSVWEMYGALLYGGKLLVIPRETTRDTQAFLELVKRENVTILNQTPSAFYNFIEMEKNYSSKFTGKYSLKLRTVIFGGEALNPSRLKEWNEKFPEVKLINMFGITETTVHVTYKEIIANEIDSTASNIGKPIPTLAVFIVDQNSDLLPPGVPGEMIVAGAGVCRGYLNRPELTRGSFVKPPLDPAKLLFENDNSNKSFGKVQETFSRKGFLAAGGSSYKSGDLGKLVENGDIIYLGRIDQQVQVRGFRVEVGEVENRLMSHSLVKEALVVPVGSEENIHLCAYIVPVRFGVFSEDRPVGEVLKPYLAQSLPEYMIPVFFVVMERIPLTSNGKVDRKALPDPLSDESSTAYTAPRNGVENKLVKLWSEVLGLSRKPIGIYDNFFELGGHSLKATVLIAKIHKEFEVKVPLAELFENPTISWLSEHILGAEKETPLMVEAVEARDYYPLSSAQKRLYFVAQLESAGTGYNIPIFYTLEGDIDQHKLENVFKKLIHRHSPFRTSFLMKDGHPVQWVHEDVDFRMEYYKIGEASQKDAHIEKGIEIENEIERITRDFIKPFDLARAPLARVGLIRVKEKEHILMLDMHHIITDGASMAVVIDEFAALYMGNPLAPLKIQYKDYAWWANTETWKESALKKEKYWEKEFPGKIPVLEIPADFPRSREARAVRSSVRFLVDEYRLKAIKELVSEEEVTLFIFLLSAYTLLLSKISGSDDIIVGTTTTGRWLPGLDHIVGMFVNTLALRNFPSAGKTFREYLREVGKRTLETFENQDYPFEQLVDLLKVERTGNRNPLFDTMIELQNFEMSAAQVHGLSIRDYSQEKENAESKFDLVLMMMETGNMVLGHAFFNSALFRRETVEKWMAYFTSIILQIVENPDIVLSKIRCGAGTNTEEIKPSISFNDDLEDE